MFEWLCEALIFELCREGRRASLGIRDGILVTLMNHIALQSPKRRDSKHKKSEGSVLVARSAPWGPGIALPGGTSNDAEATRNMQNAQSMMLAHHATRIKHIHWTTTVASFLPGVEIFQVSE